MPVVPAPIAAVVLAAALMEGPAMSSSSLPQPVTLETEQMGDDVRIRVIGEASAALKVSYRLVTEGGAGGGRNHATQAGTSTLTPGKRAQLISVSLRHVADNWCARLAVSVDEGPEYEVSRGTCDD